MVPAPFLYHMEWNQTASAQTQELSARWGESWLTFGGDGLSDARAPYCAQGVVDSAASPCADVHALGRFQAQPSPLLDVLFYHPLFIYDSPHFLRSTLTLLKQSKHTPYIQTDLQISSEIAAFVYLQTDVITENNFH